jgi:F420-non-reducing hydrogenase iron-sulfur subunit
LESHRPRIIAFCCDKSGYGAADMAGRLHLALPDGVEVIRVPCAGRIDAMHMLQALEQGVDGVLVFACHENNCQSLTGSRLAKTRMRRVHEMMGKIGIEQERLQLHHVATNQGARFAEIIQKKNEDLMRLGSRSVK